MILTTKRRELDGAGVLGGVYIYIDIYQTSPEHPGHRIDPFQRLETEIGLRPAGAAARLPAALPRRQQATLTQLRYNYKQCT